MSDKSAATCGTPCRGGGDSVSTDGDRTTSAASSEGGALLARALEEEWELSSEEATGEDSHHANDTAAQTSRDAASAPGGNAVCARLTANRRPPCA